MQLPELQQILGHAQLETVFVYATADAEMKRAAIGKATAGKPFAKETTPIYRNNDNMIRRLHGLR